jgi:hypothetical protein
VEERKREGLGILESWIGVPISMNSVLDGLTLMHRREGDKSRELKNTS